MHQERVHSQKIPSDMEVAIYEFRSKNGSGWMEGCGAKKENVVSFPIISTLGALVVVTA